MLVYCWSVRKVAMDRNNLCKFFFLVALCRMYVYGGFGTLEEVTPLLDFGLEIYKIVDGQESASNAKMISEIQTHIDTATTKVITTVLLQSKLERVDDAVLAIKNAMVDLDFIIKAKDLSDRRQYQELFVKRFDANSVEMHLRFLPEFLKYNIPGTSGPLIDLFSKETRCNMTAIYEFERFYFNLVSAGIATEMIYLHLTSNLSMSDTRQYWTTKIEHMKETFTSQIDSCKQQFEQLAYDDVVAATDGFTLRENNNQRYAWLRNNVFFLKSYATSHFLYMKFTESYIIQSNDRKFVIFTDKNETVLPKTALSLLDETAPMLQASVHGETNEDSARNVGNLAENYLLAKGYALKALLVFFDGGEFEAEFIKTDNESQLIQTDIAAKMQYCIDESSDCRMVWNGYKDLFKSQTVKDVVYGKLRVYAYVDAAAPGKKTDRVYKTATGNVHRSYPVATVVMLVVLGRFL